MSSTTPTANAAGTSMNHSDDETAWSVMFCSRNSLELMRAPGTRVFLVQPASAEDLRAMAGMSGQE